jgi:DNA polymerase I
MIVLFDVSNLAHRVYHTTFHQDVSGEPCGIPVGFLKTAARVMQTVKELYPGPHFKIAVQDFGRCLWRTEMYPEYKQKRKKPPIEDFMPQMDRLESVLPSFGFTMSKTFGTEADDLIGVYANELVQRTEEDVIIVSSDRDLWQLVNDRIQVYDLQTGRIVNWRLAEEDYGFPISRIVEYKALVGDSSDNIPGAKGIGDVMGRKIMAEWDVLELVEHIEAGKIELDTAPTGIKKVAADTASVRLAGKLCTLATAIEDLFTNEAQEHVRDTIARVLEGQCEFYDPTVAEVQQSLLAVQESDWSYAFE